MGFFEWVGDVWNNTIDEAEDNYAQYGKDIANFYDDITGASAYKQQGQGAIDAAKTESDAATLGAETAAKAAEKAAEEAALAEEAAAALNTEAARQAALDRQNAAREAARVYSEAVDRATAAQKQYSDLAIAEQQRQFGETEKRLNPWMQSGQEALSRQRELMGLGGADAQRSAIEGISGSPEMLAMIGQGENALLQQGSATGGLRGGNTAAALAQFRPSMLSELINRQYERFAGMSASGQNAATSLSGFGAQSSGKISDLLTYQGDALAQGEYSKGEAYSEREKAIGEALAQGKISVAEAESLGLRNAAAYRSQGTREAGMYRGQGIKDAGAATAAGQYANTQAQAGASNARWSPIRGGIDLLAKGGLMYLTGGAAAPLVMSQAGGGIGGGGASSAGAQSQYF